MNTKATKAFANFRLVNSTAVRFVAYDSFLRELRVIFHSGLCYDYKNVAPEIYEEMVNARSVGRYHNAVIRGKYRYSPVDGAEVEMYLLDTLQQYITSSLK